MKKKYTERDFSKYKNQRKGVEEEQAKEHRIFLKRKNRIKNKNNNKWDDEKTEGQ